MLPGFLEENLQLIEKGQTIEFFLPYFDFLTLVPMVMKLKKEDGRMNGGDKIHGQTILPEPGYGDPGNLVFAEIYYKYGERL